MLGGNKILSRQIAKSARLVLVGDAEMLRSFCQLQLKEGAAMPQVECFVSATDAVAAMLKSPAELVVTTLYTLSRQEVEALTTYCSDSATQLFAVPAHVGAAWKNVELVTAEGGWSLTQRPSSFDCWCSRLCRRVMDLFLSVVLLLTLFPIFYVVVALCIKRHGAGSVLVKVKRRNGKGKTYSAWYFRTQHQDADRELPIGAFLQRTHFEELPQLLNVLVGQMSMVGPQLHKLQMTDTEASALVCFMQRHRVKAGMTGWARVQRNSTRRIEDQRRLEMDFVREWTLWKDIVVLWRTLLVMLLR